MTSALAHGEQALELTLERVEAFLDDAGPSLARLLAPRHAECLRAGLDPWPLAQAEARMARAWLELGVQGFRPAVLEAVPLQPAHAQFARQHHDALLAAWHRYAMAAQGGACPAALLLKATCSFAALLPRAAGPAARLPGYGDFRAALAEALQEHAVVVVVSLHLRYSARHFGAPVLALGEAGERTLSERLQSLLKPGDLLARLDGDHYVLALCALRDEAMVEGVAARLCAELAQAFEAGGVEVAAVPRLGLALAPRHARSADTLLRFAQAAAQQGGEESGFCIFDPVRHLPTLQHASLEAGLRAALEDNELALFFQPQLDLVNWRVDHVEALLRWPAHPAINPALMVEAAERSGCLDPLTRWVVNTALRQHQLFAQAGYKLGVSVNLAPSNLGDVELADFVAAALATWDAQPDQLTLEITEGSLIQEAVAVEENLERLHGLGVRLSIDDFGTGYSSLAYLKRLPAAELKIDHMFVRGMLQDPQDRRIVKSVLELAANFGLEVVAEGVEDRATLDALARLGCRRVQGHWLSPGLEGEALLAWLGHGPPAL